MESRHYLKSIIIGSLFVLLVLSGAIGAYVWYNVKNEQPVKNTESITTTNKQSKTVNAKDGTTAPASTTDTSTAKSEGEIPAGVAAPIPLPDR